MASERCQRQIDRLLDEAEAALSQFDWESVRQCAQAVLAIDPQNDDGLTFLARIGTPNALLCPAPPFDEPVTSVGELRAARQREDAGSKAPGIMARSATANKWRWS